MSKLDEILDQFTEPTGKEVFLKDLKQQIKELFKEGCDDLYASGDLPPTVYAMLIVKVEEL